ncbi:MAG: PCI domain-containing protein [Candidatus Thorarchaeota archaeon]|nr:MAG: hypothetical protein DRP09_01410 [Candidatus Thorarchaeota archaeon]
MQNPPHDDAKRIEAAIKDLDLDYMRGLISEDEYNKKLAELQSALQLAGGEIVGLAAARATLEPAPEPVVETPAMTDPVSAVRRAVESFRKIAIEKIAQEAGVPAMQVTRIIQDLLDGRELSGRIDHDSGDFILGTGTGPAPKTIAVCPFCRNDLNRIAVKGETITCNICRESFIVS